MIIQIPDIPLQAISDQLTIKHEINLFVLRADLNHPLISGNKLFKLKYNLQEAFELQKKTVLTFGGAFSNHIAATAAAGKEYNFSTIGIIRGEEKTALNPTLQFAQTCGMDLHYVSRKLYQNKNELYNFVSENFKNINFHMIPEGGSNELGIKGCEEITNSIHIPFNYIATACGTGTTLAGIVRSLKKNQKAIGFQVLKGEGYIKREVEYHISKTSGVHDWRVNEDYHFGGYAKVKKELVEFIHWFEQTHSITLDDVYTGKMIFGIYNLMQKHFFKPGETIIALHTGGLQGNYSFTSQ